MLEFLHFTWIDFLDILMVTGLIFLAFRWIKGSTAVNIFVAIILVLLVYIIASSIGMKMISSVLGTLINVGAIALIIIFQPEIRRFLNSLDAAPATPWRTGRSSAGSSPGRCSRPSMRSRSPR
jgi:DNA integrity scanning protein DisA with diadenylate cyclase activity